MNRDSDEEWLLREKYNGVPSPEYRTDCLRLKAGEPLAYVIGHIPFLNTTIFLDSKPLIPRPETEYWVHDVVETVEHTDALRSKPLQILDLCAGSGCIGVSLLKALPNARVDFVEIDVRHHETILKNVYENGLNEARVRVFDGNLFYQVSDTYDLIVSNPPYIDTTLDRTEESVYLHEPHLALFADDGGFHVIGTIIREAPPYLTDTGFLIIEHEPEHTDRVLREAPRHGFEGDTYPDQYGVPRYTKLKKRGRA